jgi:hypothetical protein
MFQKYWQKFTVLVAILLVLQPTAALAVYEYVPAPKPELAVVTAVAAETFDATPDFTFSSTDSGKISYEGDCSSATVDAVKGNNTVTFKELALGIHYNCKITVNGDASGLTSEALIVPTFEIKMGLIMPPDVDVVAPVLQLKSGVTSPTDSSTPSIVFETDEKGTITYEGSCVSSTIEVNVGENLIVFSSLVPGTYDNCKLAVTDWIGNVSESLIIPTFVVQAGAKCAGFIDIADSDADCDAIAYVKSVGAMTGNPDGSFKAEGDLQRDQIAKIALKTFGKFDESADYCDQQNPFPDVSATAWSYQYICRAKALAVVTGYTEGPDAGFFRPERLVNRAEFLAFVLRNLDQEFTTGDSYTDVSADAWFNGYAKFSMENGLFSGNTLSPANFTSRREVARVLYKLHLMGKI